MKYETVRHCGKLGLEFSNVKGYGSRVSRDFMRNLLKNIVKRSTDYYDETEEHIFTYREKQMHSVVCPSIADVTLSYVMEHPLIRKPAGEEEYPGNVDYWISYRNYSFLMELKHTYFGYRNADNPRKEIIEKFEDAIEQLESIRKDMCRELIVNNNGLIKIALETVIFYEGSKNPIGKDKIMMRNFKILFKKLMNNTGLKYKSNLRALWILNDRLIKDVNYGNWYEIYPAVAFIGNISEVIE